VKQRIAVLLMLGMLPWAELHAQSQAVSATLTVSARVEGLCEVTAGNSLQGTALLHATCTPGSTYNVGLNEGTIRDATANQRKLVSASQVFTVTGVGTGFAVDHTVFGAAPASEVIPAGGYADIATVRVYY
jgi:spore coat protein U-like protein